MPSKHAQGSSDSPCCVVVEVVFHIGRCVEYTAELKTHLIQTTMHEMLDEDAKPIQLAIGVSLVHSMAAPSLCLVSRAAGGQTFNTTQPPRRPFPGSASRPRHVTRPGRASRGQTAQLTGNLKRCIPAPSVFCVAREGRRRTDLDAQPVGPPVHAGQAASRVRDYGQP